MPYRAYYLGEEGELYRPAGATHSWPSTAWRTGQGRSISRYSSGLSKGWFEARNREPY